MSIQKKWFVGYQKELADPILDHGPCEQRKPNNMIHKTNQTKNNMDVFFNYLEFQFDREVVN